MASLFDDADEPELKINPVFAKKYEDRKKREELSNLKDKYGDSESEESESTSEEEDETGQLVTPFLDAQIVKTIASIKRKDPEVYDPKTAFFEEEEVKKAKEAWKEKQKKKEKPVTLKDLQRKRLLEGKLDGEDYEEEGKKLLTMVEEQEKAKRELKVGWIR
jgi:protein KRI1